MKNKITLLTLVFTLISFVGYSQKTVNAEDIIRDIKNGKERVIDFLSYPGNYGFIPSTLMDEELGGDGDALDILVIAESLETGDTISVIPIGTLLLNDSGELDTKIIAVPADPKKQVIQATDYQTFTVKYNMAQRIVENWFLNYNTFRYENNR